MTISPRSIPRGVGLYIHIPFCSVKCHYCDFACFAGMESRMEAYVAALEREMRAYPRFAVATVYLGGGTPSLLPPDLLDRLLGAARESFGIDPGAEITMEINPGTGSPELWSVARRAGINRVSVGAQVFSNAKLAALGRDHTVADIRRTVSELRKEGLDDLSLDLLFGLPHQNLPEWITTLEQACELEPEHFSVYGLQVEERTAFGVWQAQGRLELPGEDAERDMLDTLVDHLAARGYRRYEISSWSRPGFESAHNRIYWQGRPYVGLGSGAHSYYEGRRYAHGRAIDAYIRDPLPHLPPEPQLEREAMEEAVFLALRQVEEGLDCTRFRQRFGRDVAEIFGPAIAKMVDLGFLERTADRLRLTPAALPVANAVFTEFIG